MTGLTLTVALRIPPAGVADFQSYEDRVLPLLSRHGGVLERRLRNADGTVELHILRFTSREAFQAFREDPERTSAAPLFAKSGASAEVIEMRDV